MSCIVKLQFELFNSETKQKELQEEPLYEVDNDYNPSIDDIVEYIIKMPKSKRNTLAAQFRAANVQKFSTSDIKNHIFISNTSIDTLKEEYPDLKNAYENIDIGINDNFTLIKCNKMEINGSKYFGRTLDSAGNEIFFINGYYGSEHFFKYLSMKNKIDKVLENNKLIPEYKSYQNKLNLISQNYNLSIKQLLLNYLNNEGIFKPFVNNGEPIIPSKIINDFFLELNGQSNEKKSDLQYTLESIQSKTKNPFQYKLPLDSLYDILEMYFSKFIPSKEQFLKLDQDQLSQLLNSVFISDAKLARSRVLSVTGGETSSTILNNKEGKISQIKIKDSWKKLQEKYKQQGINLDSLNKTVKNSKEQVIGLLKEALSDIGYQNVDISIQDDKIAATYKEDNVVVEKTSKKYVILNFPWSSIGEIYNFGYNTKYLFSPVKKSEDDSLSEDGLYKGVYIYKYYNNKFRTTHYAISRSIISPESYMHTFQSLNAAKQEIDKWQNTHKLNEWGLWSIKQQNGRPRNVKLEYQNIKDGQIITVRDLSLPSIQIKNMPQLFKNAFSGSVSSFHNTFSSIENIKLLNTPEEASAFLFKFYDMLRQVEPKIDGNIFSKYSDPAQDIIQEILNSPKISYRIEAHKTVNKILLHTVQYLNNNGTDIQLTGKFDNDESATKPLISSLENASKYFNDLFGIKTTILSADELNTFIKNNNIGEDIKNVRAFVFNGDIYINSSNSDMSDFFHEISHIFLGVLKAKYPKDYIQLIEDYSKIKGFNNQLSYVNKVYKNFSYQDKVEEAVVSRIAQKMFNKKSLVDSFKGKEFLDDFELIFSKYPELASESQNTGLEFSSLFKSLLQEQTVRTQINKNMLLSQTIMQLIKEGKIKEICI